MIFLLQKPIACVVQRHILYKVGRDNSVDNGIFIHAIVPRHVETVALLSREAAAAGLN